MSFPRVILFTFLLFPLLGFTQQTIVKGIVKDVNTKKPLAFVNIVSESGRGTTTDIDGKFSIRLKGKECCLKLTYVGYEKLEVNLDHKKGLQHIFMSPKRYELDEVEVFPGINPAHRIIDSVVKNRDLNNPQKLDAFRYVSYDKMIVTADIDSTWLNDTTNTDSIAVLARSYLQKQDIFIMETVTERMFKSPGLNQENVLATKVSGFKDPMMAFMISQIQSTSFYDEQIKIVNKNYINPISRGSTRKYFFQLEDTTYTEKGDTVFVISFRPLLKTNFDGMKGFLSINTHRWAIQNVKAQPAKDTTGIIIKIEQSYEFVQGYWFPYQLHTDVIFQNAQLAAGSNSFTLVGNGRSYIQEIDLSPDLKKSQFGYSEVEIEEDATRKKGEFWSEYRVDSLTAREKETYRVVDSIGKANNFDKLAGTFQTLLSGRIPWGPIDFELNKLIRYNNFEGFYLGVGIETNDRFSKKVRTGGFWGYGFGDKRAKYGGNVSVLVHKRSESRIRIDGYYKAIASGGVQFFDEKYQIWRPEYFYKFFVNRMNYTIGGELDYNFKIKPLRDFKWNIGLLAQEKYAAGDYYFTPNGDTSQPQRIFNYRNLKFGFKFSFRERTIETTKGQVSFGSDYPVVWFNYTRSFSGFLNGDYNYHRFDLKVQDKMNVKYLGEFSWRLTAGYIIGQAPLSNNYDGKGTYRMFALYAPYSFGTMRTNEFYSSKYASLFLSHNFKNLLFEFKRWKPELMLVTNIGFGALDYQQDHNDFDYNTMEKGYYESGLVIRKILDLSIYDIGVGVLYRYGPYSFENISLNFAYKFSLFYAF